MAYYLIALVVNFGASSFDVDAFLAQVEYYWNQVGAGVWDAPAVDVFLPIRGETKAILLNTWSHVHAMAAYYRTIGGSVRVFVLDDGADSDMARIAVQMGFTYLPRPKSVTAKVAEERPWFEAGRNKKAGNLHYAFWMSEYINAHLGDQGAAVGKHIAIFDADFAPAVDYLHVTIPPMELNGNLGILQTPQFFRVTANQNWLENGASAVQELFYRFIQQSRNQLDGAICVGTNAIYRRVALAQNGGGPTRIDHSEDVHTGFDLRILGWDLQYIPIALAAGVCPSQRGAFASQQYRWCMGSLSLLFSRKFWAKKMGFRTRCCYLSGFCYYIHTAIFTFVGPMIPLVLMTEFVDQVKLVNYALILPSLIYNLIVFRVWHKSRYGIGAWAVKLLYGWAHAFAIVDKIRGHQLGWSATGSIGKKKTGDWRIERLAWLVGAWGLGTGGLWVGLAVYHSLFPVLNADFVPNLFSGLLYVVVTLRAISPTPQPSTA